MKQFDEILRQKTEKAFSSYNADHLADEGWKSFVAARKGKRRLGGIIPLWAKAASVAVIVGTASIIAYQVTQIRPVAETLPSTDIQQETASGTPQPITRNSEPGTRAETGDSRASSRPQGVNPQLITSNQQPSFAKASEGETRNPQPSIAKASEGEARNLQAVTISSPSDSLNLLAEAALKEFLEAQAGEAADTEPVSRKGRTGLLAGVSGLLAQSGDGATVTPGMAVGVYLERKLSSRISFRPGLTLAVNNLNLHSNGNFSADKYSYSVPLYDGNSGTLDYYDGRLSTLAMEIPLNFVFRIIDRERSGLFLTTGASTVFYLSQSFDAGFVNAYTQQELNTATGEMVNETRYSTVEVNNDYGAFSRTDLMGLANFSAGYSVPYGKTGSLLIEPFVQLPLADLTSLNLRVRYGGVSMKLRFGGGTSAK
ncbi:MAG: hypothetical protein FJY11_07400 [Bacteroidetes bacterium]|nr:hypothetical protein [Bacteroidota bacterium]